MLICKDTSEKRQEKAFPKNSRKAKQLCTKEKRSMIENALEIILGF